MDREQSNFGRLLPDSEELVALAAGQGVSLSAQCFASLGSTQDYLQVLPAEEVEPWLVVVADEQTKGHGRLGRFWDSVTGQGAWFSVVLPPIAVSPKLPIGIGLAVLDATQHFLGSARLKWPNDLVVPNPEEQPWKLGGLVISLREIGGQTFPIVGIGVNLRLPAENRPTEIARGISDFASPPSRNQFVISVVSALKKRLLASWDWIDDYRGVCCTLGEMVEASLVDGESIIGLASDVDQDGGLVIGLGSNRRVVLAGDVLHLRREGLT